MIAEQPKSPPGLPLTINFKIPADWTPEQVLVVLTHRKAQTSCAPRFCTSPRPTAWLG